MKSMRIPVISLALGLAGAVTAAWGAESVMTLISTGEAIIKEVNDTKAVTDAAVKRDKELADEGKQLSVDSQSVSKDNDAFAKESADLNQRIQEYNTRCSADKKLNQDQYKACKDDGAQLNQDVSKVNADKDALNKKITEINARIPKHNEEVKGSGQKVKDTYAAFNEALKREGVWLDQARSLTTSAAFKPYGQKANCPDLTKPSKTTDAMMKMAEDALACLKRVSGT